MEYIHWLFIDNGLVLLTQSLQKKKKHACLQTQHLVLNGNVRDNNKRSLYSDIPRIERPERFVKRLYDPCRLDIHSDRKLRGHYTNWHGHYTNGTARAIRDKNNDINNAILLKRRYLSYLQDIILVIK